MDRSSQLFKKWACYLSFACTVLPLVAFAQPQTAAGDELPALLEALQRGEAMPCTLPTDLDGLAARRLARLYQVQGGQPLWSEARRQQLREQLESLDDDGLDSRDYPLVAASQSGTERERLCADLLTSHAYLQALRHLRGGRLSQPALEPLWRHPESPVIDHEAPPPGAGDLDNLPATFAAARPALPQYQALRQAYAAARQQPLANWAPLPAGPLLKPGRNDARVPALRQRLLAEGYPAGEAGNEPLRYDETLVEALTAFQRQHNLQPDGILGPFTLGELNVDALTRRDQLRINLERLRWLADDLAQVRVAVNVAGAELHVLEQGREIWRTRTQVGRPKRKTPLLRSQLQRLTLNPSWTVPPTIYRQDKLPKIRADIGFLARNHLQVLDAQGNRLDPEQVDWNAPGAIRLRQPPGPSNPLGRLALRFPNPFTVYLHDTPSQALFDKSPRLFSSGCVRVEAVQTLLTYLLPEAELAEISLRIESGKQQEYPLAQPIPLLLAYWTVEIDERGLPRYSPDLYDRDPALIRALLGTPP